MKSLLKRILKEVYSSLKRLVIPLIIIFLKLVKPNIVFVYDASKVEDGIGAQLHRILSMSLVSFLFQFRMMQPRIQNITIHPLDPIQDPLSLQAYLKTWNKRLFSSKAFSHQKTGIENGRNVYIGSLTLRFLILLSIQSKLSKIPIIVHTKDCHAISDFCVEKYRDALGYYFSEFIEFLNLQERRPEIIVHYRQGSGGFAIYPGQNIPRQIPINMVTSTILKVLHDTSTDITTLRLFTDSPERSFRYRPSQDQIYLWKDMPGFDGATVFNESSGIDRALLSVAQEKNLRFVVDREIDAFNMIVAMASCRALFISRSSLSYVGGLFNSLGEVYYPTGFWHTRLKGWRIYK